MTESRRQLLERLGFSHATNELLLTLLHREVPEVMPAADRSLLGSEIFVPDWLEVARRAQEEGALAALREVIFELNFPIEPGVSGSAVYRELALAGGKGMADVSGGLPGEGPRWERPQEMKVFLHDTGGGLLPIIVTGCREDFVTLVQAIIHHNEPKPVPASMGSVFINGYPNRRRYLQVRQALSAGVLRPEMRDPQLWRDRFVIISPGPYSGVEAATLGLDEERWREISVAIRIDHECAHYLARRLFPRLKFGLQDELVADFVGLMSAVGRFEARTFNTFMGLEGYPDYRAGGRFENYQRELQVSGEAFAAVGRLLVEAGRHLEEAARDWDGTRWEKDKVRAIAALTQASLEHLASGGRVLERIAGSD